jgi:hypothetical protein
MKKTYAYHKPSAKGIEKIALFRKAFSDFAELIEKEVATTRETALALTNLEQASMWLNKAIILADPESTVDPDATFGKKT